jgi:hypothetical protein
MRTRIAAALTGLVLATGTLVGTAVAGPGATDREEEEVRDEISKVVCPVLKELKGVLDQKKLDELLKKFGCDKQKDPTQTTTTTSEPSDHGGH